jgi:hypothetical protein
MALIDDINTTDKSQIDLVIDAGNTFTQPILVLQNFNLSIIHLTHEGGSPLPAFAGTVTIQRAWNDTWAKTGNQTYIPPGELIVWNNVAQYTDPVETIGEQPFQGLYRVGILTGEYTSGKVLVRIGV